MQYLYHDINYSLALNTLKFDILFLYVPSQNKHAHDKFNFLFNFATKIPLLSAPCGRTFAIIFESTGILHMVPFSFGNLSLGITFIFLSKIRRDISTLSSRLRFNRISGTGKMFSYCK